MEFIKDGSWGRRRSCSCRKARRSGFTSRRRLASSFRRRSLWLSPSAVWTPTRSQQIPHDPCWVATRNHWLQVNYQTWTCRHNPSILLCYFSLTSWGDLEPEEVFFSTCLKFPSDGLLNSTSTVLKESVKEISSLMVEYLRYRTSNLEVCIINISSCKIITSPEDKSET